MSIVYVKVYHGPCTTFHSMERKPQRLYGLVDRLQKLGFRVDLHPVAHFNYCMLEICGLEVFRCNICNLKFSTFHDRDPVCQRAIQAVVEAATKIKLARNTLWLWTLIDHQMFRRGRYAPKDYWPVDVDVKTYAPCRECVECCGIRVRKKECVKEDDDESDVIFTLA